jgi:hypothetical protein
VAPGADVPDFGGTAATAPFSGIIPHPGNVVLQVAGMETLLIAFAQGNPNALVIDVTLDNLNWFTPDLLGIAPGAPILVAAGSPFGASGVIAVPCAGLQAVRLRNTDVVSNVTYQALAGPGEPWLPLLGPHLSASSIPVVLALDQAPIPAASALPQGATLVKVSQVIAAGADGVIMGGNAGTTIKGFRGRLTASAAQAAQIFSLADTTNHVDNDLFDLTTTGPWNIDYQGAPLGALAAGVGLHNYAAAGIIIHGYLILLQS